MDTTASAAEKANLWLTTASASWMLDEVTSPAATKPSARKLRLAACACCRQVWGAFGGAARLVVEYAERYADGQIPYGELALARDACPWRMQTSAWAARALCDRSAAQALAGVLGELPPGDRYAPALRCVLGNPFRPASLAPFRTHELVALADAMYREASFERMDILADALEDAGCGDGEVLSHCRAAGGHWRGCWVVDGILGRS